LSCREEDSSKFFDNLGQVLLLENDLLSCSGDVALGCVEAFSSNERDWRPVGVWSEFATLDRLAFAFASAAPPSSDPFQLESESELSPNGQSGHSWCGGASASGSGALV
jgi:hypothetical protein